MSRIFALADLHLSLDGSKPMDVFGDAWRDHAEKMAASWDATVDDGDAVLLAGDLSWARSLEQAAPDLRWIGARPGRKILLRGNHDSWWGSLARVVRALPPRCEALQNNAHDLGSAVVLGARGWIAPDDPEASAADAAVFHKEIERLKLSVADADRRFGRSAPRIAVLHYPPWILGRAPTEVVRVLRDAEVRHCVYGHLHGEDHRLAVTGEREGLRFHFAAADATGFAPLPILP